MDFYAGFDSWAFPEAAAMPWLSANSGFRWCGYYLAPVYVGQQEQSVSRGYSSRLTAQQGTADAVQAAANARAEGFPESTCIYLDWEDGTRLRCEAKSYLSAWAAQLVQEKFHPGFYCSHLLAGDFQPLAPAARLWCWKVPGSAGHEVDGPLPPEPQLDPSGCGVAAAFAWQYQQNAILAAAARQGFPLTVDMSTALWADPGAPSPG